MARLIPCTACSRPIRVTEQSCPFCDQDEDDRGRDRRGDDRLPNMPYGCVFPDPDARVRT